VSSWTSSRVIAARCYRGPDTLTNLSKPSMMFFIEYLDISIGQDLKERSCYWTGSSWVQSHTARAKLAFPSQSLTDQTKSEVRFGSEADSLPASSSSSSGRGSINCRWPTDDRQHVPGSRGLLKGSGC
jgi:hypothetical protein